MFGFDPKKAKAAFRRFRENLPLAGNDLAKRIDLIVQLILDLEQAFS